jgi:hypothetical protein
MFCLRWTALCLLLLVSTSVPSAAQEFTRPDFRAERASEPPVIDGALDDAVWQREPAPTGEFLSYNPLHGSSIPQKTTVWISYDNDYPTSHSSAMTPIRRRSRRQ